MSFLWNYWLKNERKRKKTAEVTTIRLLA